MRIRTQVPAALLLGTVACSSPSPAEPRQAQRAAAVFAGGCFWCTEADFDKMPGVISTTSGYIGGRTAKPTYEQVSAGGTGHIEAVQVIYDPQRISYEALVRRFLPTIDVTDGGGQFCDRGDSYRPALFVADAQQKRVAQSALGAAGQRLKKPIAVEVLAAGRFWPAEAYHQNYYKKNPARYRFYRWKCGRDQRLKQLWG
jgi:peptide-methionine (S)-S-oxide reductase